MRTGDEIRQLTKSYTQVRTLAWIAPSLLAFTLADALYGLKLVNDNGRGVVVLAGLATAALVAWLYRKHFGVVVPQKIVPTPAYGATDWLLGLAAVAVGTALLVVVPSLALSLRDSGLVVGSLGVIVHGVSIGGPRWHWAAALVVWAVQLACLSTPALRAYGPFSQLAVVAAVAAACLHQHRIFVRRLEHARA
jgi:hypothetical protein